ncbi:MAG: cellulose biosynthesis protein BcsS [Hyphomicrobiaceae bacterium]
MIATCFAILSDLPPSSAQDERRARNYELWVGVDVTEGSWLSYTGATYSPFGDIHAAGLKLRASGGYGEYRVWNPFRADFETKSAQTNYIDGLVGYLWRLDPLIAKLFVGYTSVEHSLPDGVGELIAARGKLGVVNGQQNGLKIQAEFWLNITEKSWGSLDLSWTSAHNIRSARARYGYKITPQISLGVEGSVFADEQVFCIHALDGTCTRLNEQQALQNALTNNTRFGAFARYSWDGGELSASGGVLGKDRQYYGKANYLFQF